jgi:ribonuclease P protein subunit RPR2
MIARKGLHGKSLNNQHQYSAKCKNMNATTRQIARQRVRTLFALANKTFREDPALAQRYAQTARKIAMAAKIRLPMEYRRQICRHCKSFMIPGINCRVRTQQRREPHVVITCLNCLKHTRIPLAARKEKPRP